MIREDRLVVLRFRDIEIPLGETITRHRTAIAEHGFCWWGWLYREYERNPRAELARLGETLARVGGFPIALFDTGRGMVFHATCAEIRATSNPQRSPQPVATPDYYNDRRAPAWFRLTDVDEVDCSFVVGRTCVEMPSASEDCCVDLLGQVVNHIKGPVPNRVEMRKAQSSGGRKTTTESPPARAVGGMRHGASYQEASSC